VEGIQYQSGSFPLIDVESGNCLRSFLHQSVTKLSKREGQPKKLCYFQTFGQEVLPERYAKACTTGLRKGMALLKGMALRKSMSLCKSMAQHKSKALHKSMALRKSMQNGAGWLVQGLCGLSATLYIMLHMLGYNRCIR